MPLTVRPPIKPMLARLTRELPSGDLTFEPKWDGFRTLAFIEGGDIDLRSRHDRPLARYFPEVVAGLGAATHGLDVALDGEIVLAGDGSRDFGRLMSRLHPAASRVEQLSRESPAAFIAFDILAVDDDDLRDRPFIERRARLEDLLAAAAPPVFITAATRDRAEAEAWLATYRGEGVDGVVAKPDDLGYEPGRRSMIKVKLERTVDCVVAGLRLFPGPAVSSLILGLYDDDGRLHHVGVVTNLPVAERIRLVGELAPLAIDLEDHPWRDGFIIGASPLGRLKGSAARWTPDMEHDWVPLRPTVVAEVAVDQVDGDRFRHPARLHRWRRDRTPESCTLDQLERDVDRLGVLPALTLPVPAGSR
jgi:ATP-dependent DNA ligase